MKGSGSGLPSGEATREQMSLMSFASLLGSSITEAGIGDETRREATLLLSLLATKPNIDKKEDLVVTTTTKASRGGSVSSIDTSSCSQSSRRSSGEFSFTCPSLSLESRKPPAQTPASLLGRPLMVDDLDALRLNADAMARNVLQSFQKALEWRIGTWRQALSKSVWEKEKDLLKKGALEEDLKDLLLTKEACLIVALQQVSENLRVTGSTTCFRVQEELPEESPPKRSRVGSDSSLMEDMASYTYSSAFNLLLDCVINLETPAGYSEITLHVPGSIEGTFLSGEPGTEEIKSVVINLNTGILSAMIEKGCRTIVRSSVESWMESTMVPSPEESGAVVTAKSPRPADKASVSDEDDITSTLLSPAPNSTSASTDPESGSALSAAVITPAARDLFPSATGKRKMQESVMLPIPDDFDERVKLAPRRISPQPGFGDIFHAKSSPQTQMRGKDNEAIISPPPNPGHFHEVPENGPSLPMLVEAACRAMRN